MSARRASYLVFSSTRIRSKGPGVIHRGLKPANSLVTADGQPRLLDVGSAKLMGSPSAMISRSRETIGSDLHGQGPVCAGGVGVYVYTWPARAMAARS
jgi:serine/threonine protein kinase